MVKHQIITKICYYQLKQTGAMVSSGGISSCWDLGTRLNMEV